MATPQLSRPLPDTITSVQAMGVFSPSLESMISKGDPMAHQDMPAQSGGQTPPKQAHI